MRWKDKPKPSYGDVKDLIFFAWLPVYARHETRWLEIVHVSYYYYENVGWVEDHFIDDL
jgi:hypothetical protein